MVQGLTKIMIERSAADRLEAFRSEARELRLRTRALSNMILEENGLLQKHGITNERLVATSIQCVNASIALGLILEESAERVEHVDRTDRRYSIDRLPPAGAK
jgi:hypothetical protein